MIRIKQLNTKLDTLIQAYNAAYGEFGDSLYIAWMVDFVFDGKAPPLESAQTFSIIITARRSKLFRNFWDAYKEAKTAMGNFQFVNMGMVAESVRKSYMKKFKQDYPGEVPF